MKQDIEKVINNNIQKLNEMKALSELQKFDGKKITKRITTHLGKGWYLTFVGSLIYLECYLNPVYDNRWRINLSHDSHVFNWEKTKKDISVYYENITKENDTLQHEIEILDSLEAQFSLLKQAIDNAEGVSYTTSKLLKKKYDIDFKSYYRGE